MIDLWIIFPIAMFCCVVGWFVRKEDRK